MVARVFGVISMHYYFSIIYTIIVFSFYFYIFNFTF